MLGSGCEAVLVYEEDKILAEVSDFFGPILTILDNLYRNTVYLYIKY